MVIFIVNKDGKEQKGKIKKKKNPPFNHLVSHEWILNSYWALTLSLRITVLREYLNRTEISQDIIMGLFDHVKTVHPWTHVAEQAVEFISWVSVNLKTYTYQAIDDNDRMVRFRSFTSSKARNRPAPRQKKWSVAQGETVPFKSSYSKHFVSSAYEYGFAVGFVFFDILQTEWLLQKSLFARTQSWRLWISFWKGTNTLVWLT